MPSFTLWTATINPGSSIEGALPSILNWLNTAQNSSPPAGKAQKPYGLNPDGTVYQYLYAIIINSGTPDPADTSRVFGLTEFGFTFSDKSAVQLNRVVGKAYAVAFDDFIDKAALDTAIASVVVSPSAVAAQLAVRDDIQAIVSAETAKAVSASVDADQIRAEAIQAALERVNTSQVFSDVSTRIYNALAEDSDDIITSANISLFRGIIAKFETKLTALETRFEGLE